MFRILKSGPGDPGANQPAGRSASEDREAARLAVLLASLLLAAALAGSGYLRNSRVADGWRTSWACAVAAAAVMVVAFLGVFWDRSLLFGPLVFGHPSWGLLGFSGAFLLVGAVMITFIGPANRSRVNGEVVEFRHS